MQRSLVPRIFILNETRSKDIQAVVADSIETVRPILNGFCINGGQCYQGDFFEFLNLLAGCNERVITFPKKEINDERA